MNLSSATEPNAETNARRDQPRLLVFRQDDKLDPPDLARLRSALQADGTNTVLWVLQAQPGHLPGTVEVADERLLVGYVSWLSGQNNAHSVEHASWASVCREAYALWRSGPVAANPRQPAADMAKSAAATAVTVMFGKDGNGPECAGSGWSTPEDGFTWAIGDRSRLVLAAPPKAPCYTLEFDVIPFRAPPLLQGQRLSVSVNGTLVQQFDRLPRGRSSCVVPGHLLRGRDSVEILLEHPDAARPCDAAAMPDDRRLAIAFRSLTLDMMPEANVRDAGDSRVGLPMPELIPERGQRDRQRWTPGIARPGRVAGSTVAPVRGRWRPTSHAPSSKHKGSAGMVGLGGT